MSNSFYSAFEDKFRGSRELIKSRLRVYLPFVEPLRDFYDTCQAVDLGCGRGEWLELLQESGFDAQGVDLDDGMLATCREREFKVHTRDAVEFLKGLPETSQVIVSGFHIAEHMPFSELQVLVQEALRVLKPGGLLILETPNAENITVGTEKFYLDPTHHKPIPSQFLFFMAEYAGFERIKVLRLQEPSGLANENALILLSVLNGVSPDYAVVAQKGGATEVASATTTAFEANYGLSLENLANNYDRQIKTLMQQANAKAQQAEVIAQQAEAKAQQAEVIAQQADAKAQQAEVIAQQADAKAQQAEVALIAIHNSSSWRLTAPLRKIARIMKSLLRLPNKAKSKLRRQFILFLVHTLLYTNRRPRLKRVTQFVFSLLPSIKPQLAQATLMISAAKNSVPTVTTEAKNLSPRAHHIYLELKDAINNHSKEKT